VHLVGFYYKNCGENFKLFPGSGILFSVL